MKTVNSSNPRDPYWDNLKAVLIFLVVLGHFLMPVFSRGRSVQAAYTWIYLFHMPAFVFVSGCFSKSHVGKEHKEYRLNGFLILFFLFTFAVWTVQLILKHSFSFSGIVIVSGAPWYLLSMFFWYLFLPYLSCISPKLSFPALFILSLLAGVFPECGDFLAISRTIVFFPFFLAGYYSDQKRVGNIRTWMRIAAVIILAGVFAALYFYSDQLSAFMGIAYANSAYSLMGLTSIKGILVRSAWYGLAGLMTAAIMCVIPSGHYFFTYVGERTLAVYMIHRLLRDIFSSLGLYQYLGSGWILLLFCSLVSCMIIFCSSHKKNTDLIQKAFHAEWIINSEKTVKS